MCGLFWCHAQRFGNSVFLRHAQPISSSNASAQLEICSYCGRSGTGSEPIHHITCMQFLHGTRRRWFHCSLLISPLLGQASQRGVGSYPTLRADFECSISVVHRCGVFSKVILLKLSHKSLLSCPPLLPSPLFVGFAVITERLVPMLAKL
jgi:hypothetical protein